MTRIVAALFLFFYGCTVSSAQQARQYTFSHLTTADGLAANFTNSIVQDKDGYIWIATINGLQRYDGNFFLTIKAHTGKDGSIPTNNISILYRDKKDRIWLAAANNDVGLFNTKRMEFKSVLVVSRKSYSSYTGKYFFEDFNGNLLLHDFGNLYKYDETTKAFQPANSLIPTPKNWKIARFYLDIYERKYWIGADSGIAVYNPETQHLNYRGHNPDKEAIVEKAQNSNVYHLLPLKDKMVYCTWPAYSGFPLLFKIDRKSGEESSSILSNELALGYHEINGFIQQKSGRVWILGNPVLAEWGDGPRQFTQVPNEFRNEQSIKFDHMFMAYEDRERNMWLATDNGVFYFNPDAQVFNTFNLIRKGEAASYEAPVQATAEMADGSLFVGCWGKGLFLFNKHFEPLPLPQSLKAHSNWSVWDMCISEKAGKLWIGLQPGAVVVYDPKTKGSVFYESPLFNKRTIRQIVEDTEGNMWLGSQDGKIFKWNVAKAAGDPTKGYELISQNGLVQKMHIDNKGFLWVAALGKGLLKIDTYTNELLQVINASGPVGSRLFSNEVYDMTQYDDSTLIVAAGCINVIHLNTGKVDFFDVEKGLPSNSALAVQKDDKDILWVGMRNGLCRINLAKNITTSYDRRDGIVYDNFTGAGVEKLHDGKIIFYTDHNFLTFDPARFFQAATPPKPLVTSIALEGKPLSLDSLGKAGTLDLQYNNTSLVFEFSGLSFTKQKKLHYYFKLEGVDDDWIHIDNDNRAFYNYLGPGNYTFKVKSENADGLTSNETQSVTIVVNPPIWRTWWFLASMILILGLGLFIIDRERLKRLRTLQQMRTQIAGSLHQEVETTLGNINVLSEIAKIRASTNVEQSKEFIDQISQKSRYMMEAMDDVMWSIDPKNDSMGRTLLRLKEFTEGIRNTHDPDIDLIVDPKVQSLQIDMPLRHELFFYYKEVLTFLVAHTGCEQIFVHLKQRKSVLLLEMLSECDENMLEFQSKLQSVTNNRTKAMGGVVDITTDRNNVSIVLQVPV